jgi:acyl carrier protein
MSGAAQSDVGSPRCPKCKAEVRLEPTGTPGNLPCPKCGHVLWAYPAGPRVYDAEAVAPIMEKIAGMIEETLKVKPEQINASASFMQDLGADSLDIVELVMALEEEFKVTIPDEQAEKIKTVADAVDYILQHQPK